MPDTLTLLDDAHWTVITATRPVVGGRVPTEADAALVIERARHYGGADSVVSTLRIDPDAALCSGLLVLAEPLEFTFGSSSIGRAAMARLEFAVSAAWQYDEVHLRAHGPQFEASSAHTGSVMAHERAMLLEVALRRLGAGRVTVHVAPAEMSFDRVLEVRLSREPHAY